MNHRAVSDDLRDVGPAIAWVGAIVEAAGLSTDVRFAVDLGLEEALANLIMHGRARAAGKGVALAVEAGPAGVKVVISDHCAPFDITEPGKDRRPTGFDIGGRGLRLLRAFVSDLDYRALADRNELTLKFAA